VVNDAMAEALRRAGLVRDDKHGRR
jgi:hypothetical protein